MMKKNKLQNSAGFTLIELAVIITIMGLILAPFFNFLSKSYRHQQMVVSTEKNEKISAALSMYLLENDRYPCPANWATEPDEDTFGLEQRSGTSCTTGSSNITLANGVYYGYLPVKTLKLPLDDGANIHGWKYLYAISQTGVNDASSTGAITVNFDHDYDGTVNGTGDNAGDLVGSISNVQFVVVDTGKDGKGSATMKGVLNFLTTSFFGCTGSASDIANCNTNDAAFNSMPHRILSSPTSANYYDDTLIFSLVSKDTTFWTIKPSANMGNNADIVMRGSGTMAIGIDDAVPNSNYKLQVRGGNVKINSGKNSLGVTEQGTLITTKSLKAEQNVSADRIKANKGAGSVSGFFYSSEN